jgi:diguanylate cyclase (GGDEF)-like protein
MHPDTDQPPWLPALNRGIQRLGRPLALLALGGAGAVLAALLAQALIGVDEPAGERLRATSGAALCGFGVAAIFGHLLLRVTAYLDRSQQRLSRHGTLDPLTGIFNRRHFLNLVEREWSLARRYETPCALVLMDVDHLRKVNEGFGASCGDVLLRRIAEAAGETLRQADVLARFGGEEFVLFLPHTDPLGALDVAERIRERVAVLNFCWNGHSVPISLSLGVAALRGDHIRLDQLIHEADEALLAAKSAGRNCVRAGAGLLPGKPSMLKS